ncbi:MAG: hypothetical protein LVQ96_02025 [Thermoplasmatales archaeon]|nr:hypothetical protein [Thermoplasmatales archaeon]MCW6169928.1 hypothetical protein [Thermoplasmatales archaeon]
MNKKIKYLGVVFMATVMVFLVFSGITHAAVVNNKSPVVNGDSQAIVKTSSQNATVIFAKEFDSWYLTNFPGSTINEFKSMSTVERDTIVKKFLEKEPSSIELLRWNRNQELLRFNSLDAKLANKTFSSLRNEKFPPGFSKHLVGANVFYEKQTGSVSSILLKISPDSLPKGVYFDSGMWVMVTVNYFVYHAPWWLGGWSVTYGEHDVINSLYAGNSAQRYYNHVTSETNDYSILASIALAVLGATVALAPATIGLNALAGAIIGAALIAAGAVIQVLQVVWDNDFTSLYESTYANEHSGDKYIWMFDSVDYYYPWVTVVGSLVSSIGMYGYLSNMNTITFIPNVPMVAYESFSGVAIVASISDLAHEIANKIGWNTWGYGGSYS